MKIEDELEDAKPSELMADLIESIDRLGGIMARIEPPEVKVAAPNVNPVINVMPTPVTVEAPQIHIQQHSEWIFKFTRDNNQNVDTVTAKAIK